MTRYILRRVAASLVLIVAVTTVTFVMQRVLPIDPVESLVGPIRTEERLQALREQLGLDQPLARQYANYMSGLARGDLGQAWHTGQPVTSDLASRFAASLELGAVALVIGVPLGVVLGVVSARRRDAVADYAVRGVSLSFIALPEFLVALLAVYVFFYLFGVAPPPIGRLGATVLQPNQVTGLYLVDSVLERNWTAFRSAAGHLALPALTLAMVLMSYFARFTRASMLEVLNSDFVLAARSLGLRERTIVYRYALKTAMLPIVSVLGIAIGAALGGLVVIELVFAWPGLGRYAVDSAKLNDLAAVQGFMLLSVAVYAVVNLGVDILQAAFDPRIRY